MYDHKCRIWIFKKDQEFLQSWFCLFVKLYKMLQKFALNETTTNYVANCITHRIRSIIYVYGLPKQRLWSCVVIVEV